MKFAVCFLAVVSCAAALPAEVSFETPEGFDFIPNNIYREPINPVKLVDLPGSRIIGGHEVAPNSVPYQVGVVINGLNFCGGSLISTNRVLTAAHCTNRAVFVQVRLAAHRVFDNEATQVRVTSTSIRNHALFDVGSYAANDIAVVLLPSAVTLSANIQVVPLAPSNAGTFSGSRALLTGWGRTTDASNNASPVLLGVNLDIISNAACASIYGGDIVSTSICSSGVGTVGACNGDSGGPLVVNGVQVGVVSFGSRECEAGNPTVFARISEFRSWIQENAGV